MKRDEIWRELQKDDAKVYGEPILDMFLKMTEDLERRHWDELSRDQKEIASTSVKFSVLSSNQEAIDMIRKEKIGVGKAMVISSRNGNLDMVRWIYENSMLISYYDGVASLKAAAAGGHMDVVEYLVDVRKMVRDFTAGLVSSAKHGRSSVFKYLLKLNDERGSKIDQFYMNDMLLYAVEGGSPEIVQELLDRGSGDILGAYRAAAHGNKQEVLKILIDKVKHIHDGKYGNFSWPVMEASEKGWQEVLRWLFDDKKSGREEDSLRYAAKAGQFAVVKWLIEDNRVDLTSKSGISAARSAIESAKTREIKDYLLGKVGGRE